MANIFFFNFECVESEVPLRYVCPTCMQAECNKKEESQQRFNNLLNLEREELFLVQFSDTSERSKEKILTLLGYSSLKFLPEFYFEFSRSK